MTMMRGVVLPGDSTVSHVQVPVPAPGHGQVLVRVKASSICGSDIRAIYRGAPRVWRRGIPRGHRWARALRAGRGGRTRLSADHRR